MELVLAFDGFAADRFRAYASHDGGFGRLASRIWGIQRSTDDAGHYEARLVAWADICAFVRQRNTAGDGGYQQLLRETAALLDLGDGRQLSDWGAIVAAVRFEERRRNGFQRSLFRHLDEHVRSRIEAADDDGLDDAGDNLIAAEEETR